jgi:2-polyprenyl-3-methyl-5-hydroxy-6-metoxy-1,4-benzoquinol methylase
LRHRARTLYLVTQLARTAQEQLLTAVAHDGERHLPALDPESANHYRHLTPYHFVLPLVRNVDVLDYGCGAGYGTNLLWRRGAPRSIHGVDVDGDAIAYCQASLGELATSFHRITAGSLPFDPGTFDIVILFQVLEHIRDDREVLEVLHRLLRPSGTLYLTTPNAGLSTADPEHPENPHHVREYLPGTLLALCGSVFQTVEQLCVHGSLRVGGRGIGTERSIAFRAVRRLVRRVIAPPLYVAPTSLGDFTVSQHGISEALDLLFVCRR